MQKWKEYEENIPVRKRLTELQQKKKKKKLRTEKISLKKWRSYRGHLADDGGKK